MAPVQNMYKSYLVTVSDCALILGVSQNTYCAAFSLENEACATHHPHPPPAITITAKGALSRAGCSSGGEDGFLG